MKRFSILVLPLLIIGFFTGCGSEEEEAGLSQFELEHGIGPITEAVELGELDLEKASRGKELFDARCTACHQLDTRVTGPRLRDVAENRTPEFIMNYILNPVEMREMHPTGQELAEDYTIAMVNMGVTQEQAREILEYLRAAAQQEM